MLGPRVGLIVLIGQKTNLGSYNCRFVAVPNVLPWFQLIKQVPHNSGHCPYRIPGRLIENLIWFSRPGVASVFTTSLDTAQECSTSAALMIIRIGEFVGSTIRLSVYGSRNVLVCWSSYYTMYEPNSTFVKSEYSYLQYHWCPTAFRLWPQEPIFNSTFQSRRIQNTVYEMISGAGESGGLLWATIGTGRGRIVHCYWQERLAVLLLLN